MDTLILSFIIIFMLHNLEEIITIERWFNNTYPRVSKKIPSFIQKEIQSFTANTATQFSVVVFVLSIVFSALILIAVLTNHFFILLGVVLLFAINIFTHPLQAIYLRCYVPGLWTTLLLIIPYNILFFYHFSKAGFLTINTFFSSFIVMFFLIIAFLLSHKIGEKWS